MPKTLFGTVMMAKLIAVASYERPLPRTKLIPLLHHLNKWDILLKILTILRKFETSASVFAVRLHSVKWSYAPGDAVAAGSLPIVCGFVGLVDVCFWNITSWNTKTIALKHNNLKQLSIIWNVRCVPQKRERNKKESERVRASASCMIDKTRKTFVFKWMRMSVHISDTIFTPNIGSQPIWWTAQRRMTLTGCNSNRTLNGAKKKHI